VQEAGMDQGRAQGRQPGRQPCTGHVHAQPQGDESQLQRGCLGRALIGRQKGDEIEVTTPSGEKYYEIAKIEFK
jgi:hypothetical protein